MRAVAVGLLLMLMAAGQPVSATQPLEIWIISGDGTASPMVQDALASQGIQIHVYEHLDMAAILAPASVAHWLKDAGFTVHRNEVFALHLDQSVPRIKADVVKETVGSLRDGPTVLVIDTGLDSAHPDFTQGENLAANVGIDRSPNGLVSGTSENRAIVDRSGHGSHVAGIVGGDGSAFGARDPNHERFVGVYSNGRIVSFQAANDAVDPDDIGVDMQAALEAFDWALANQDKYKIRVISNSWGSAGDIVPDHPVTKATLRAYAAGISVFFSAGNDGVEGSLNRHCLPPWVVCVASGTLDKTRSSFSSMGHESSSVLGAYDHPDITAPGSAIRSLTPSTDLSKLGNLNAGGAALLYRDRSGTSMAAPHAAGVAALLAGANDALSPDQIMDIIVATADIMSEETYRVGAGYINAQKAYNLAINTEGQRDLFLAGEGVKYGGLATGDGTFSDDPITVGYNSQSGGDLDAALIRGPPAPAWLVASPLPAIMLGLGCLLVVLGLRWRSPAPRYEAPTGDDTGQTGG